MEGIFRKPLKRQVDEARRIDKAEEVGKAMIIMEGKRKEIKVNKALLNRKEERFNLGNGIVRASFGTQQTRPKPPPPPPAPSLPAPPATPSATPHLSLPHLFLCQPPLHPALHHHHYQHSPHHHLPLLSNHHQNCTDS